MPRVNEQRCRQKTQAMAAMMRQNLVFDAGAPALAEMATDQRKQADPYASDYKLGAKELSFTTPALYTTRGYVQDTQVQDFRPS